MQITAMITLGGEREEATGREEERKNQRIPFRPSVAFELFLARPLLSLSLWRGWESGKRLRQRLREAQSRCRALKGRGRCVPCAGAVHLRPRAHARDSVRGKAGRNFSGSEL